MGEAVCTQCGGMYFSAPAGSKVFCYICSAVNTVPEIPTVCSGCGGSGLTPLESGPDTLCHQCNGTGNQIPATQTFSAAPKISGHKPEEQVYLGIDLAGDGTYKKGDKTVIISPSVEKFTTIEAAVASSKSGDTINIPMQYIGGDLGPDEPVKVVSGDPNVKIIQKGPYIQAEVTLKAAPAPPSEPDVLKNSSQFILSDETSDPPKIMLANEKKGDIVFYTDSCERMRITAAGEILVGQSHTHINNVTAKEFADQFWTAVGHYNPLKKKLEAVTAEKDAILKVYLEIKKTAFETIAKLQEDFEANRSLADKIRDRFGAVARLMEPGGPGGGETAVE